MIVCKNGFSWRNRFTPSTNLMVDVQNLSSLAIPFPTCKIYRRGCFFREDLKAVATEQEAGMWQTEIVRWLGCKAQ